MFVLIFYCVYFRVEQLRDSTAHAEIICIREASNTLRTWRLSVIYPSLAIYLICLLGCSLFDCGYKLHVELIYVCCL